MRILGFEFGSWSVKAVEMEFRFRRVDVLDFHEVRLPLQMKDPVTSYRGAVEQLLARLPSHAEKIVTALPPAQTALRFLQIPIKKRKKVEQMFRYELEDTIPFKLDDAIIEHHVSKNKEGSLVFAAIAPKKHIQTHIDWLRAIGVDPDWLTFEGMGIVNLYLSALHNSEEETSPTPTLLLDIGHQKTNLAVIDQGRLSLFRSIAWGGAAINQAIALNLGVPLEEAEQMKMNTLRLPSGTNATKEGELEASAIQAMQPLFADLNHSLVAFRNMYKQEITSVHISGGTAKLKGIEEYLEKNLQMPTKRFKPFENLDLKEELKARADQYRFAETWGRAMVFARKSPLLFNFRTDDMTKQTSLTEVTTLLKNPAIIKLAQYAAGLAALLFVHVTIASYLAEKEVSTANEELRKVFSDTFRSVPPKERNRLTGDPVELRKFIETKNNELEQKLKMLSKTRTPMLGLLRQISESFPKNVRVDVNTLQIDDRSFLMEGVVYEGDLNPVTEILKKIPALNEVTFKLDGQRFTYQGKVIGR